MRKHTRVLLFSPRLRERTYPGRPPIYYLQRVLEVNDFLVRAVDVDIVGEQTFVDEVTSFEPDIVAGTSLSIQINDAIRLFHLAKLYRRDAITILGGSHATAGARYLFPLHNLALDAAVAGEGLTAIVAVAELVEGKRWESRKGDIPGLVFPDGDDVIQIRSTPENPNDYRPHLDYHDPSYNFDIFARTDGTQRKTFQLMTAFGCQNSCFFCSSSTNNRGELSHGERRMDLAVVDQILGEAAARSYESVYFDDDTFTRIPEYAIEVARLCRKYGIVFGCHTRPDCEDEHLIGELIENGCRYMFSGLESAVPEILLAANKTRNPDAYKRAYLASYRAKNKLKLPVSAFLIHGMPRRTSSSNMGDDSESSASAKKPEVAWEPDRLQDGFDSIDFAVRELDPTYLSMNILRFIPGVPFSESKLFEFLRPGKGPLHGGYFDRAWLEKNEVTDPRVFHPILRAFEGAGSPIPLHMTPRRCYEILRYAVETINAKNSERGRNQTTIVVDPWFRERFLKENRSGGRLAYDLAPFEEIDRGVSRVVPLREWVRSA